ncbi:MAG: hypothetical protein BECKG1743D_GA0114223_109161, partial [Candidatus Kentron sp. G]
YGINEHFEHIFNAVRECEATFAYSSTVLIFAPIAPCRGHNRSATSKAVSIKEYTSLLVFIVQLLRCNNSYIVYYAPAVRLESERKSCAIWYILFCQSPKTRISKQLLRMNRLQNRYILARYESRPAMLRSAYHVRELLRYGREIFTASDISAMSLDWMDGWIYVGIRASPARWPRDLVR